MLKKITKVSLVLLLVTAFMVSCGIPLPKRDDTSLNEKQDEEIRKLIEDDNIGLDDDSNSNKDNEDMVKHTSTNGTFSVEAPKTMNKAEDKNSDYIGLNAGDGQFYGIIGMATEIKTGNNEAALNVAMDSLERIYKEMGVADAKVTEVEGITVDGLKWRVFEVKGTLNGVDAKFIVAASVDDNNLYQFQAFSAADEFDVNKPIIMDIIKSFQRN